MPGGAVPREHFVGNVEVFGREPEDLLHPRDLVGAERAAVRGGGVLHLWRGIADVRSQHDERGPFFLGHRGTEAGLDRVGVLGRFAELHDMPSVGFEPLRDIVGVGERGIAVDRDVVVVVHEVETAELQVARE